MGPAFPNLEDINISTDIEQFSPSLPSLNLLEWHSTNFLNGVNFFNSLIQKTNKQTKKTEKQQKHFC